MSVEGPRPDHELLIEGTINIQLQHFKSSNPPCLGLQLPDGILLRHTRSRSLYFYLRTRIDDGKIKTQVFTSDSPYDRQRASLGEVSTSMFEANADADQLMKLEDLLRNWVDFVQEEPETSREFQGFDVDPG